MSDSETDYEENPICRQIEYCNKTNNAQVVAVVTAKNLSDEDSEDMFVAWKILETQSKVFFQFPMKTEVGAFYEFDHETILCGPFHAKPGSAWKIKQDSEIGAPELLEGNKNVLVLLE